MAFEPKAGGFKPAGGFEPKAGFDPQGEGEPGPLDDVEYTGDLAEDCRRDFAALDNAYRDRARAEERRRRDATDSRFWCALVFRTSDHKRRFFASLTTRPDMLLIKDALVDGHKLARLLGFDLDDDTA